MSSGKTRDKVAAALGVSGKTYDACGGLWTPRDGPGTLVHMASLIRPWIVSYVSPAGKRCKSTDPGATKVRERSAKWYGQGVPGHPPKKRFPLATSKPVAQRMLEDLVRKAERGQTSLPDRDAAAAPLAPLIDEFRDTLDRTAAPTHVAEVARDVNRVLAAVDAATVGDLRRPDLTARAEAAVWGLIDGPAPVSRPTAAKIGMHARQFSKWLVRKKKIIDHDPFAGCDFPSQKTERPRRALATDELARLIAAAEAAPGAFRGLTGPDRAVLYLTAVATGYRAGELAALTPASFDLDAAFPVARLAKEQTKNATAAAQPLPPAVAARLRVYLAGRPRGRVWPGTWAAKAATMFRADLARAGVPVVVNGEEAVFHSLRHSYATLVAEVATVKTAQELVRHADPALTIGRYSHATAAAKADAVARMNLPGSAPADPLAAAPRSDLERFAAAAAAVLHALACTLFAPPLAPGSCSGGVGTGRMGTTDPGQTPPGANEETLGFPRVCDGSGLSGTGRD